jgi:formate--tetrahydrofolate ligase
MPSDLEIARSADLKPIADIVAGLGILEDELGLFDKHKHKHKAKIHLFLLERLKDRLFNKYHDMTTMPGLPSHP